MRPVSSLRLVIIAAVFLLVAATPAHAQWYVGLFFGGNRTEPATVSIDDPAQGLVQQFHDVHFEARPFSQPPYVGARLGRVFSHQQRFTIGVEVEITHAKVYSETAATYVVTPGTGGTSTSLAPMNATVQKYDMSHGLNFALVNAVFQAPLTKSADHPLSLDLRVGAGGIMPHAETQVLGEIREQYELGGLAFGAGIGMSGRIAGRLSGFLDYRFTVARPELTLAHGTGQMTASMHHVMTGVLIRLHK